MHAEYRAERPNGQVGTARVDNSNEPSNASTVQPYPRGMRLAWTPPTDDGSPADTYPVTAAGGPVEVLADGFAYVSVVLELDGKEHHARPDELRTVQRRTLGRARPGPAEDAAEEEENVPAAQSKPSHARMAALFAAERSKHHKFNHSTNEWWSFDGCRWQQDQLGETQDLLTKFCEKHGHGSAHFIKGTEQLARNLPEFRITTDRFDQNDWLLNTPHGCVDLRTGRMAPADPALLLSRVAAVSPSPEAPTRWLQFLHEITNGNVAMIKLLQCYFGYALTGDTSEQVLVFVHGPGGTGKTTLLQIIAHVMGNYHKAGSVAALLTPHRGDPNAPSPFLAALAGARLTTMPETKASMVFDGPTIARATGEDTMAIRDLHGKAFAFRPKCKFAIYGNQAPTLSGSSSALARRLLVVPLNVVFKGAVGGKSTGQADPHLMKKLRAEAGGILSWLVQGCLRWQKLGLSIPPTVAAASQDFARDADPISTWVTEHIVSLPSSELENDKAYGHWKDWARANGYEPGSARSFGVKLTERLGPSVVGTKQVKKSSTDNSVNPPKIKTTTIQKTYRYRTGWGLI